MESRFNEGDDVEKSDRANGMLAAMGGLVFGGPCLTVTGYWGVD